MPSPSIDWSGGLDRLPEQGLLRGWTTAGGFPHRIPWGKAQIFDVVYTAPPIYQAFHADSNVSKQDTHFFNTFSVVIGLLIVIAIGIFALARVVASETQDKQVLEEKSYLKSVEGHLQPVAKEAVAGADNTALAIKPDAGSAELPAVPAADPPRRSPVRKPSSRSAALATVPVSPVPRRLATRGPGGRASPRARKCSMTTPSRASRAAPV